MLITWRYAYKYRGFIFIFIFILEMYTAFKVWSVTFNQIIQYNLQIESIYSFNNTLKWMGIP